METFWVRSIVLRVFSPTCDRSDERYDSAFEARNSSSNEDTATVSAVVSSVIFPVSSCVRKKYAKATDAPAITVIAIRISDIKIFLRFAIKAFRLLFLSDYRYEEFTLAFRSVVAFYHRRYFHRYRAAGTRIVLTGRNVHTVVFYAEVSVCGFIFGFVQ